MGETRRQPSSSCSLPGAMTGISQTRFHLPSFLVALPGPRRRQGHKYTPWYDTVERTLDSEWEDLSLNPGFVIYQLCDFRKLPNLSVSVSSSLRCTQLCSLTSAVKIMAGYKEKCFVICTALLLKCFYFGAWKLLRNQFGHHPVSMNILTSLFSVA